MGVAVREGRDGAEGLLQAVAPVHRLASVARLVGFPRFHESDLPSRGLAVVGHVVRGGQDVAVADRREAPLAPAALQPHLLVEGQVALQHCGRAGSAEHEQRVLRGAQLAVEAVRAALADPQRLQRRGLVGGVEGAAGQHEVPAVQVLAVGRGGDHAEGAAAAPRGQREADGLTGREVGRRVLGAHGADVVVGLAVAVGGEGLEVEQRVAAQAGHRQLAAFQTHLLLLQRLVPRVGRHQVAHLTTQQARGPGVSSGSVRDASARSVTAASRRCCCCCCCCCCSCCCCCCCP